MQENKVKIQWRTKNKERRGWIISASALAIMQITQMYFTGVPTNKRW